MLDMYKRDLEPRARAKDSQMTDLEIYHVTPISGNSKVGAITVTTTGRQSCPSACPHKDNGCYADQWPLVLFWDKLTAGLNRKATNYIDHMLEIRKQPDHRPIRINQAGDLPVTRKRKSISVPAMLALDKAIGRKKRGRAWTYTHHKSGLAVLLKLKNLVVNVSCDSLADVDKYKALGHDVAVVLPLGSPKVQYTPKGEKVLLCPAQQMESITCETCLLCAKRNRKYSIGFEAHGNGKKKVEQSLRMIGNK